jgi:hypothetical protein
MLVGLGYTAMELMQLNWVRVNQDVLFLSDVMNARGRSGQDSASLSSPLQKRLSVMETRFIATVVCMLLSNAGSILGRGA